MEAFNLSGQAENGTSFEQCNIYLMKNSSVVFYKGYAGVPENLLINLGLWLICIIVFCILRQIATTSTGPLEPRQNMYSNLTSVLYGQGNTGSGEPAGEHDDDDVEVLQSASDNLFSCLKMMFTLKDADIMKKCGADAVQYLSFQRHCILYTTIIFLATLIIIIPVNINGDLESPLNRFGITTISNVDPSSPLLWVHVLFSFLSLPLCLFIMRRFSKTLVVEEEDSTVCRTIMITGINRKRCEKELLVRHFDEAYSDVHVKQVHFAYDIRQVHKLEFERRGTSIARHYCEKSLVLTGDRLVMRPYKCGICCNCPCYNQVDALLFYQEEENHLMEELSKQKGMALTKPLGIAFVTFETPAMAKLVKSNYKRYFRFVGRPDTSSVSTTLQTLEWEVFSAPAPNDVLWANLSFSRAYYWGRAWTINIILFIILFFLTTPAIVFDNLYLINVVEKLQKIHPEVSHFLPSFFLWAASILMPFVVTYSNEFMNHWTRSEYNYSVMKKTFTFLLFMIVILPSLGLTSMKAFVEWFLRQKEDFRWECMFLPDSGAFFVKYVTTSAFIGSAVELIRVGEILKYGIKVCFARSVAEKSTIRKAVTWEFAFGQQYSWFLLVFSMITIYSIACPVIVPFGVVCLIMKHLVDRHNIYYVYNPSKINQQIHETAISIVTIALIVQQICFFFFSFLRSGWSPVTIASLCLFLLTVVIFVLQHVLAFYFKLKTLALKEQNLAVEGDSTQAGRPPDEIEDPNFCPHILDIDDDSIDRRHLQARTYGTNENSVESTPVKTQNSDTDQLLDDLYQKY